MKRLWCANTDSKLSGCISLASMAAKCCSTTSYVK
jgi:hypothetical protein